MKVEVLNSHSVDDVIKAINRELNWEGPATTCTVIESVALGDHDVTSVGISEHHEEDGNTVNYVAYLTGDHKTPRYGKTFTIVGDIPDEALVRARVKLNRWGIGRRGGF